MIGDLLRGAGAIGKRQLNNFGGYMGKVLLNDAGAFTARNLRSQAGRVLFNDAERFASASMKGRMPAGVGMLGQAWNRGAGGGLAGSASAATSMLAGKSLRRGIIGGAAAGAVAGGVNGSMGDYYDGRERMGGIAGGALKGALLGGLLGGAWASSKTISQMKPEATPMRGSGSYRRGPAALPPMGGSSAAKNFSGPKPNVVAGPHSAWPRQRNWLGRNK